MIDLVVQSPEQLPEAAARLLEAFPNEKIFAFYGPMGVGKTTFIKAICRQLGVNDVVSSPTFSLVNQYLSLDGEPVYHFDFYRLKTPEEAADMGCEEYFYSGAPCFIEWPEQLGRWLPQAYVKVQMNTSGEHRIIKAQKQIG